MLAVHLAEARAGQIFEYLAAVVVDHDYGQIKLHFDCKQQRGRIMPERDIAYDKDGGRGASASSDRVRRRCPKPVETTPSMPLSRG